jgi:hypothetical protein
MTVIRRELDLPPDVAREFVEDMEAFFKEPNQTKQDEIAARRLRVLREHSRGKLRLSDVKQMFLKMRDDL